MAEIHPRYKLHILQEIDTRRDEKHGVVGEILRREGLFASQVVSWRNSLEEVIAKGLPEKRRGRKLDPILEIRKERENLQKQNARLLEENRQMRLIIAAQKKLQKSSHRQTRENSPATRMRFKGTSTHL